MKIVTNWESCPMNDSKPATYRMSDDPVIRFCAFYATLYVGSLILGGSGIFLIVFGLMILFTRVAARTPVGHTYIRKFFGFKPPEQIVNQPHSTLYNIAITGFHLVLFGFYITVSIFLIWMGIKILLNGGFLNQNLIYIILFKFQ